MNIYDKVNELAQELKNCPEVLNFRSAYSKISSNSTNKKMLDDFREIQIKAYQEQMEKGKVSDETMQKYQNLTSILSLNPEIAAYLAAENKFGTLWEDIMKTLNEAVGVNME